MSKLKYNERSWAIDLITEINHWAIGRNLLISRAGGETTLKEGTETYFPDVLLFGDDSSGLILQGWELKMPDVAITDLDFYNNAKRKAEIMGLRSFLLWNVTTALLYKYNETGNWELVKTWNGSNKIKQREDVEKNKAEWVNLLHTILDDLVEYFNKGTINPSQIINSISGNGMADLILSHTMLVARNLEKKAQSNGEFNDKVIIWWEVAKSEFFNYKKPWEPLARIIILAWINKIIFAHVIKKYNRVANRIDAVCNDLSIDEAMLILKEIGEKSRFNNIYKPQLGESYIPDLVWQALKQFNSLLINVRIDKIDTLSLQTILSHVVQQSIRRVYGQFTTPYELAILVNAIVVTDKTKNMLDTCCGTGTISSACIDWKIASGIKVDQALSTVYASDKLFFPLQLATIALTSPESVNQVINVFNSDVIDLETEMELEVYSSKDSGYITQSLPQMGYIISNLPFVQQEDLKKLNPSIKTYVNNKISSVLGEEVIMNSRADLYAYIPFKQWELLEDGGKLAIIISNSWLATEWGNQFYELLNKFYQVEYVIASNNGRWFLNADVVATVLVLKKRSIEEISGELNLANEVTKYVLINESIYDFKIEPNCNNYDEINELAVHIRNNISDSRYSVSSYTQEEVKELLNMGMSKNSLFGNIKWVLNIKDCLVKTDTIFDISRGERRGWDKMFYPPVGHNIEDEYIRPVLLNSRNIKGYIAKVESDAFCCSDTIQELELKGMNGALGWIKIFETGVNNTGKPLVESLKRSNIEWYTMLPNTMAEICITVNPGDRLFFARLNEVGFVNQRLMRFVRKTEDLDIKLASALLNSIIGLFYIESLGFGRGLGALDLTPTNLKQNSYMLNYELISEENKKQILEKYKILEERDVLPILEEIDSPDRIEFDNLVLEVFNIELEREVIKQSLLELYNIRITVKNKKTSDI